MTPTINTPTPSANTIESTSTPPQANTDWSIWMLLPSFSGGEAGWSEVVTGLTQEDAQHLAAAFLYPVRVKPPEELPT